MHKAASESVDVAIVGAGIMGCATAWHLATRGIKVAVFERSEIASEQSSRAWGFIRQQGRHEAEVPLASEANRLWVEITSRYGEASTGFTPGGILVPAETADDEGRIADALAVARALGLATRLLEQGGDPRSDPANGRRLAFWPLHSGRRSWRAGALDAHDCARRP